MDLSAKMLQWLTQQGFHAVRAGNTALFPRLKSYLVAVGPGKTETKRTLISTYLGADGEGNRYFGGQRCVRRRRRRFCGRCSVTARPSAARGSPPGRRAMTQRRTVSVKPLP